MPIIDYEAKYHSHYKRLLNNPNISETNKEYVRKYVKQREANNISYAAQGIFLDHIQRFLINCPEDVKSLFKDVDEVNRILSEVRNQKGRNGNKLGNNTYATTIGRAKTFVTWLNRGKLPKSFHHIKRKFEKRALTPNDMLSEQEILDILNACEDIQLRAMLSLLLDGQVRPSEFYDLKIKDLTCGEDFIKMTVNGKTGIRPVFLHYSIPDVSAWLNKHPLKEDPNAYLWVSTYNDKNKRPSQRSMRKRIERAFQRANVRKPYDFYALRHNSNVRKKRDGVPDTIAARQAGHSIKEYAETYGRLCDQDMIDALKKVYRIDQKEDTFVPKKCKCGTLNSCDADICTSCGNQISYNKKITEIHSREVDIDNKIKESMEKIIEDKVLAMLSQKINGLAADQK